MVVGSGSGTGPTVDSLSTARARREVVSDLGLGFGLGCGFALGFGLGFELFDSESLLLEDLLFLEVLSPLFLFLFLAPPPPVVFFAVPAAVCNRCRRLCRMLHYIKLQRGDEEMVCHCAIVLDRCRINDRLNRFSVPVERDFENLAL